MSHGVRTWAAPHAHLKESNHSRIGTRAQAIFGRATEWTEACAHVAVAVAAASSRRAGRRWHLAAADGVKPGKTQT